MALRDASVTPSQMVTTNMSKLVSSLHKPKKKIGLTFNHSVNTTQESGLDRRETKLINDELPLVG